MCASLGAQEESGARLFPRKSITLGAENRKRGDPWAINLWGRGRRATDLGVSMCLRAQEESGARLFLEAEPAARLVVKGTPDERARARALVDEALARNRLVYSH